MISIKKLRQIDCIYLVVFVAYTIDIGNLKYLLAMIFAMLYVAIMALRGKNMATKESERLFLKILYGLIVLFLITFALQVVNGFQQYAINEAIYFITPLVFAWIYVSNSSSKKSGCCSTICFLYQHLHIL